MKDSRRITVVAAVIGKDGKFLIAKRHKGDKLGGKWEFPGGKVEPGEVPEQALRREIMEELNIDTKIGDLICKTSHDYPHISIELLAYRAEYLSGEIVLRVHEETRWVDPAEMETLDFPEANNAIVQTIRSRFLHER